MKISAHPFQGDTDVAALVQLVAMANAAGAHHWHVGDVWWGLYQNTIFEPREHVRLWETDGGHCVAFGWFEPPGSLSWVIHPHYADGAALAEQILLWGEQRCGKRPEDPDGPRRLLVDALDDDRERIALLERHGYVCLHLHMLQMQRDLDQHMPPPELSAGWTVREVAGPHEFEERVATHREVWHPSRVTMEAYRRLRDAPGYDPALDLVAVAPEGGFGAYCICWLDRENRIGQFEPVGTRPAYRGQGLGRAVMREGLRRLQVAGARRAVLITRFDNHAAVRLYESVGFRIACRPRFFARELP